MTTDDVYQQGIRTIGAEDIAQARELGYTIKLLGIARNTDAASMFACIPRSSRQTTCLPRSTAP